MGEEVPTFKWPGFAMFRMLVLNIVRRSPAFESYLKNVEHASVAPNPRKSFDFHKPYLEP